MADQVDGAKSDADLATAWPPAPVIQVVETAEKPRPKPLPKWIALILSTVSLFVACMEWGLAAWRVDMALSRPGDLPILADDGIFVGASAVVIAALSGAAILLMRSQHRKLRKFASFAFLANISAVGAFIVLYALRVLAMPGTLFGK